jgi:desulfoferrodoxin (superoxide reductase-like protein)
VLNGFVGKVVVGEGATPNKSGMPIHPMVDDPSNHGGKIHFIETIWVEDQDGKVLSLRSLSPSEPSPAHMYFDIPSGTTSLTAYEYCNKHGLFQGETVTVSANNIKIGARSGCSMQQCREGASITACQAFTAEFSRITGPTAKDDPTGKHKPYLLLDGTTATIVVGKGATPGNNGSLIHPMSPSADESKVHWIQYIFARDEFNNLVALCELLPTDPSPATCKFEVPSNIIFLRPFEFCNKHGLYVGTQVQIAPQNMNPAARRVCGKRECTEGQPSVSEQPIVSAAVQATLNAIDTSTKLISTINMCLFHLVVFVVATKNLVYAGYLD